MLLYVLLAIYVGNNVENMLSCIINYFILNVTRRTNVIDKVLINL